MLEVLRVLRTRTTYILQNRKNSGYDDRYGFGLGLGLIPQCHSNVVAGGIDIPKRVIDEPMNGFGRARQLSSRMGRFLSEDFKTADEVLAHLRQLQLRHIPSISER